MMTLGGVQLFWPTRLIAVFPGRDEYRVVSGGNSEGVFLAYVRSREILGTSPNQISCPYSHGGLDLDPLLVLLADGHGGTFEPIR